MASSLMPIALRHEAVTKKEHIRAAPVLVPLPVPGLCNTTLLFQETSPTKIGDGLRTLSISDYHERTLIYLATILDSQALMPRPEATCLYYSLKKV
jgi:hypothetical protein